MIPSFYTAFILIQILDSKRPVLRHTSFLIGFILLLYFLLSLFLLSLPAKCFQVSNFLRHLGYKRKKKKKMHINSYVTRLQDSVVVNVMSQTECSLTLGWPTGGYPLYMVDTRIL